jgi:hypothetical protein
LPQIFQHARGNLSDAAPRSVNLVSHWKTQRGIQADTAAVRINLRAGPPDTLLAAPDLASARHAG